MIKKNEFIDLFLQRLEAQMKLKLPDEAAEVEFLIRTKELVRFMIEGYDEYWEW